MFRIEVKAGSQEEIQQILNKVLEATDAKAILDESGAVLFNRLRTRFLQEKDPSGAKWPPSKAALRRKVNGRGGGTLFDTGRLYHSIQLFSTEGNSQSAGRAIGTDVPYAGWVNYGTVKLPPRIFMDFAPEDLDLVEDLIIKRIEEALA